MLDYFTFNTLITPYIIGYVYFIGAVIIPIIIFSFYQKSKFKITSTKLSIYILLGFSILEIFWRIFCEFFMVYFKIFLSLQN